MDFLAGLLNRGLVTGKGHSLAGIVGLGDGYPGAGLVLEGLELGATLADEGAEVFLGDFNLDFVLLGEGGEELLLGRGGVVRLS